MNNFNYIGPEFLGLLSLLEIEDPLPEAGKAEKFNVNDGDVLLIEESMIPELLKSLERVIKDLKGLSIKKDGKTMLWKDRHDDIYLWTEAIENEEGLTGVHDLRGKLPGARHAAVAVFSWGTELGATWHSFEEFKRSGLLGENSLKVVQSNYESDESGKVVQSKRRLSPEELKQWLKTADQESIQDYYDNFVKNDKAAAREFWNVVSMVQKAGKK